MNRLYRLFVLFAIALYPLLFLFANNRDSVQLIDLIRPLTISVLLVGMLFILLRWLMKDADRAAVLATLLWALFSLYGHLYQALRNGTGFSTLLGRHSLLAPLCMLAAAVLIFALFRMRRSAEVLLQMLGVVVVVMVALPLLQIGMGQIRNTAQPVTATKSVLPALPLEQSGSAKPDVYYIILDTYTRADVIQQEIGLDTTPFLNGLRARGFFVGTCSRSNYDSTRVSLASSLNMDFIPNLDARFTPENDNNALLDGYILHSKVRATLESLGYRTVAFATGFNFTEMTDAAEYLAPARASILGANVQPFEALWLKTTGVRLLFDIHPALLSGPLNALSFPHSAHVERQRFLLDRLPTLASEPGPKFVFAHVLIPHVPLVFRADGSITQDDRYFRETFDQPVSQEYLIDGYRNQVEYLNGRLLDIIDQIQRNSAQPPVIILQGDHGLLYFAHNPILYAVSFPGQDKSGFSDGITPVNTFRLFFNEYFKAGLALLPDEAFLSTYSHPYAFQAAPAQTCP